MNDKSVAFEETMSFHQARERLRERLRASDFEFWQWVQDGRIELYVQDLNHRCIKLAHERTGISGSLPEHPDTERHLREGIQLRRFLREEIESYDPAREDPPVEMQDPADYPFFFAAGFDRVIESDDNNFGFNPSGRYVSYHEVIEFLSKFAKEDEVVEHLRLETDQYHIHAYGLDSDEPPLEDSYFPESEIVALATVVYGRTFDDWDAISRKRADRVPRSEDAPEGDHPRNVTLEGEDKSVPERNSTQEAHPLAIFREMERLAPTEISFRFVVNNMIEVRARNKQKRVTYELLGLLNKTNGELNKEGIILLGMSNGRNLPRNNANTKSISRLRTNLFRDTFGIEDDPFQRDWAPHFSVEDKRNARDERAKCKAKRVPHIDEVAYDKRASYPFETPDDDDPAAQYLKLQTPDE